VDEKYLHLAQMTGKVLAKLSLSLVYGGARVGLMGAMADAAMASGGSVLGVIPAALRERELAHQGLTELVVCDSMATRKATMFAHSAAFVTLAGGFGTLDELYEVVTERQIGLHHKRIAVLNTAGFYDGQRDWLAVAVREKLISGELATAIEFIDHQDLADGESVLTRWLSAVFTQSSRT
jgi:uncharacterized protein (TIGR00730 family)